MPGCRIRCGPGWPRNWPPRRWPTRTGTAGRAPWPAAGPAFVRIHGAGRTGACLASFLAASGVGHVVCADPEPAEPADLTPAGLIEADLGAPREEGAARAVGRAAPWCRTGDDGTVPDLVVLTRPVLPDLTDGLLRDRVPHLAVSAEEAIGVIGPLVRPGRSACLRCVDLRKADADPAWPKIVAQATFARVRPQACDTVLAAMAAALACAQALALIDRPLAVRFLLGRFLLGRFLLGRFLLGRPR